MISPDLDRHVNQCFLCFITYYTEFINHLTASIGYSARRFIINAFTISIPLPMMTILSEVRKDFIDPPKVKFVCHSSTLKKKKKNLQNQIKHRNRIKLEHSTKRIIILYYTYTIQIQ